MPGMNGLEFLATRLDELSLARSREPCRTRPSRDENAERAGVVITVDSLPDESGIVVADDGPGIPTDITDEVFEPGFSSRAGGTGFGLAIVNEIVDAHGWTIVLDEQVDGSRFEIRF